MQHEKKTVLNEVTDEKWKAASRVLFGSDQENFYKKVPLSLDSKCCIDPRKPEKGLVSVLDVARDM